MAKKARGVNPNFSLGIEIDDKPIRSGNFLEESGIVSRENRSTAKRKRSVAKPKKTSARAAPSPKSVPRAARRQTEESRPTRTRLNVRKVTRANLDAVVALLERAGDEDAVAPSEVVDALVSVAYEARSRINGSGIRRRGKYGTQQHDTYRQALAHSLGQAIAEHLSLSDSE